MALDRRVAPKAWCLLKKRRVQPARLQDMVRPSGHPV